MALHYRNAYFSMVGGCKGASVSLHSSARRRLALCGFDLPRCAPYQHGVPCWPSGAAPHSLSTACLPLLWPLSSCPPSHLLPWSRFTSPSCILLHLAHQALAGAALLATSSESSCLASWQLISLSLAVVVCEFLVQFSTIVSTILYNSL